MPGCVLRAGSCAHKLYADVPARAGPGCAWCRSGLPLCSYSELLPADSRVIVPFGGYVLANSQQTVECQGEGTPECCAIKLGEL